ncbi:MAG: MoaF N-terminal domain-containing protein [Oscillospiraceae bacterium]|nr:MoaF N-terminal domain-containing protein [Oscillospiraceae bacterium]
MDLKALRKNETAGFGGYSIPACHELAGESLSVTFENGEEMRIDFAARPELTLSTGPGKTCRYKCAKTGANSYFVSFADGERCTSLAVDAATGLVTRVETDASAKPSLSFGKAAHGADGGRQSIATDDFAGNAFVWSFGAEAEYVAAARYEPNAVTVSYPLMGDAASDTAVSGFAAVRLSEGVYLQSAAVTVNGQTFSVALVSNFNNMLCAGGVFGVNKSEVTHLIIGGYGSTAGL